MVELGFRGGGAAGAGLVALVAMAAAALPCGCAFDPGGVSAADDDSAGAADASVSADAPSGQPDARLPVDAAVATPDAAPPVPRIRCTPLGAGPPPNLDGELAEWLAVPFTSFDIADAELMLDATPNYVPSMQVTLRCQHDAAKIYLAMQVSDDDMVVDSAELYNDDSVTLYLDARGDAMGQYGTDDHEIVFRPSDPPNVTDYSTSGSAITFDGSIGPVSPSSSNWVVEASLQKSTLGVTGALPSVLGADIALVDDDKQGGQNRFAYGLWHKSDRPACASCCQAFPGQRPWCDTTMFTELVLE